MKTSYKSKYEEDFKSIIDNKDKIRKRLNKGFDCEIKDNELIIKSLDRQKILRIFL